MKQKQTLLLATLVCLSMAGTTPLFSQCTGYIPGDAVVITSTGTSFNNGQSLWICSNVSWGVYGNNNIIYAESNTIITVSGNYNKIFVKAGSSCSASSGTDTIIYDLLASISGQWGGITPCSQVTFDLSNAPTNGCVSGIAAAGAESFAMFPNPANGQLNIHIPDALAGKDIRIVISDNIGHIVSDLNFAKTAWRDVVSVETGQLEIGAYAVHIISSDLSITRPLMIMH